MAGVKGKSGTNPNSLKNLKNINENVTRAEKIEAGKKGGKASGESRRRKKEMKEIVLAMFEMGGKPGKIEDDATSLEEMKGKNLTVAETLVLAQVKKALLGDTKAFECLRDTAGMRPITEQKITADVTNKGKLDDILAQLTIDDNDDNNYNNNDCHDDNADNKPKAVKKTSKKTNKKK